MKKHTPSPWAVHDGGRFDSLHESGPSVCAEHEDGTCQPLFEFCGPADPEEREANGYLAAAAPELLAACKLAQKWLTNCVPINDLGDVKPMPALAAAIAKAEGR